MRKGWHKGVGFSLEHREKLSKARLGKIPWNKGINTSQNQHLKTGEDKGCLICGEIFYVPLNKIKKGRKFCSRKCGYVGRENKGTFEKGHPIIGGAHSMPHTEEGKKNLRLGHRKSLYKGEKIWNWKGGSQSKRHQEMGQYQYKDWRKSVFERDNYTCMECGGKNVHLHADHVKSWSEHEELRYDVNNGITLCYKCHYKKTFPEMDFDENRAILWGIPKKYRKEAVL